MSTWRAIFFGLLSGVLCVAAYRMPYGWPLSFVALVPLYAAIFGSNTRYGAFIAGTLSSAMAVGAGTVWFFSALPLPAFLGVINPWDGIAFATISFLSVALVMGLSGGVFALVARALNPAKTIDMIALAALYAAGEWLRMPAFNAVTYSPEVHNPIFFSAGMLGYPLMDADSWRQFAVFGIVAVSFVAALVNALFFACMRADTFAHRWRLCALIIAGLAVFSLLPIVSLRSAFATNTAKPLVVAFMSLPDTALDAHGSIAHLAEGVSQAAADGAALIVLPEGAHLFHPFGQFSPKDVLPQGSTSVVIDSGTDTTPGGEHTNSAYADSLAAMIDVRDKVIFTPEGEYLPAVSRLLAQAGGGSEALDRFDEARTFTQGTIGRAVSVPPTTAVSVMFCLEVMEPGFGVSLAALQHAELIAVVSSHTLLHASQALSIDTLRFSRAQAVEAGLPLVNSVSGGMGFALDAYGMLIQSTTAPKNGFSLVSLIPAR